MEDLLNINSKSHENFEEVVHKFDEVENLFSISDTFDTLMTQVSELDSLVEMNKF